MIFSHNITDPTHMHYLNYFIYFFEEKKNIIVGLLFD